MSKQAAVRIPDETYARLKALADQTGRTTTYYIREAIEKHLEDLEDIYLAEQRLADVKAGRSKTIPLEEIMKRHGMDS